MLGIDLVEVARLSLEEKFIDKIADEQEKAYILKSANDELKKQRLAALWAVKEAVMKALGLGKSSGVRFKDIKLCHEKSGKPYVELMGVAKREFDCCFYGKKIEVSISHEKKHAVAVAIIV